MRFQPSLVRRLIPLIGVIGMFSVSLVAIQAPQSASAEATYSLASNWTIESVAEGDGPLVLGVRITTVTAGSITALKYYRHATNAGPHTGSVWDGAGNLLASQLFTNETASGWQQVTLTNPVSVVAGATFTIGYSVPSSGYVRSSYPVRTIGPLTIQQGVYNYTDSVSAVTNFPSDSVGTNYMVDLDFATGLGPCAPTTTIDGSYTVVQFKAVGACNWTVPGQISNVEALVVGGGGGGSGGGGGAGGVLHSPTFAVAGGQVILVRVGDGGAGNTADIDGVNGQSSQFDSVEAFGGGGGGRRESGGLAGASSGGAGQDTTAAPGASSQGFPGATGPSSDAATGAGGGGGAGSAGVRGALYSEYPDAQRTPGGNGGDGLAFSISGASTYYGGGGGGGANNNTNPTIEFGRGGLGGGGNGTNANNGIGQPGTSNTGGGGGGGDWEGSGAKGGSGIVIIRYSSPVVPVNSAVPTISGTNRVGETLTATSGTWSGSPTSYAYQWKRASTTGGAYSNIGSASSSNTYVLTDDDADKFIKVSVVATNIAGPSSAVLSAATTAISPTIAPLVTTTTTPPSTTTTVKAAVTIDIQAPVTTVAQGQASVATIAPGAAQTSASAQSTPTTVVLPRSPVVAPTTTLAPVVQQNQATLVAPKIPDVKTGESALDLGGVKEKIDITRENNQVLIKSGALSARLSGLGKNGATSPLDKDGNLQLESGDIIRINVGGFKPDSMVDVWFFSTPTHLGSTKVGTDGTVSGAFRIPLKAEKGSHRIAITAKLENGKQATFTLGVRIGAIPKTSTLTRILIAIPIMMAIGAGLILPNQIRRRRRREA